METHKATVDAPIDCTIPSADTPANPSAAFNPYYYAYNNSFIETTLLSPITTAVKKAISLPKLAAICKA